MANVGPIQRTMAERTLVRRCYRFSTRWCRGGGTGALTGGDLFVGEC